MLKQLITTLLAWGSGMPVRQRAFTKDVAFTYRMGAGFPGDVNRTHPADIEPVLQSNTPFTAYGQAVVIAADGTNGVRPFGAGDGAVVAIWGVTVRPFPTQQRSGGDSAALGAATPPTTGVADVLKHGYIMVKVPATDPAPAKGGAVFVRIAAAAADDPVGGFKTQADGGNTAALTADRYCFNGPADANGNVELIVRQ